MRFIPAALTRGVARQTLVAQQNAPTLLFGAGVLAMIGSTALACRATLKVEEVLDKAEGDLEPVKGPDYPEEQRQKDTAHIYRRTGLELVRLYAPAIIVGAAGVVMLTKSHSILMKRNAALTAAYVAVDEAFRRYRSRVREKYGDEEDQRLMFSHEEVDVLDEKGRIHTQVRVDPNAPSMYARFFDPLCPPWDKDHEVNLVFLRHTQAYLNDRLRVRGHVFLNEAYEELGMLASNAGSVVGWVISDEGDNFIDFGIWNGNDHKARDFVNGREGAILLDFNVDGVVWDKVEPSQRKAPGWQR
jgi:Family of unknown function (DUF6353)